jgi:membrane protease YdiL (CAAX protease family)
MRPAHASHSFATALAGSAVVLLAVAALALRPYVVATQPVSPGARNLLLVLVYLAIATASILPPIPRGSAHLPALVVFAVGASALAIVWATAGPTAPLPLAPLAVPLSLLAAVAEEACFRRLAYARLLRFGVPAAIGGGALLFALVHVPAYGLAAFPVDLGAGLLFGWQRWASGSWTVPAATHAAANLLAVMR